MSEAALQLLTQYLHEQADHGISHLNLSDSARAFIFKSDKSVASQRNPIPAQPIAVARPQDSKEVLLERLRNEAANCPRCKALGTLRNEMVFAVGSPSANIMFIGEAPGAEEEKFREPFVGPAGQTLTKIIQAMGLKRSDVYISNICKYRPAIDDGRQQGSKNRPPSASEMETCLPYITTEIKIIEPKIIVALGSTASSGLGLEGSVGKLRGQFKEFQKIPVMVTYHPSYLLRREQEDGGGVAEKRMVWEDMLKVMEHVGLPISEKQRGYFSKARG